jgi:hypothetical protein
MASRLRRIGDLAAVSLFAILGAAVLELTSPPGWLQAVLLLPLAIALPGYAISAALFPPRRLPLGDRLVQAFVFSIATSVIGCLLLQLVLDLDREAWTALMLVTTLLAALIAALRRDREKGRAPVRSSGWRRRPPIVAALLFAVAIVGTGAAVAIAVQGVEDQRVRQSFASLWAVPVQAGGSLDAALEVGVWNSRGPSRYSLVVLRGGEERARFQLRLGSRQRWSRRLASGVTEGPGPLRVTLYSGGQEYRSVELGIGRPE